jgi:UDP-galactose transporter
VCSLHQWRWSSCRFQHCCRFLPHSTLRLLRQRTVRPRRGRVCVNRMWSRTVLVQAQDLSFRVSTTESTAGIFAVTLASLTSGLAGVVLEKLYKNPEFSKRLNRTVWARNIQLSLISIPFALSGVYLQAREQVFARNFFDGYDHMVWSVIVLQATGGIIIAFVLKFTNVIMKCIAISVSICCCAVYSLWTKELVFSARVIFGILIVIISVVAFSLAQSKKPASEIILSRRSNTGAEEIA